MVKVHGQSCVSAMWMATQAFHSQPKWRDIDTVTTSTKDRGVERGKTLTISTKKSTNKAAAKCLVSRQCIHQKLWQNRKSTAAQSWLRRHNTFLEMEWSEFRNLKQQIRDRKKKKELEKNTENGVGLQTTMTTMSTTTAHTKTCTFANSIPTAAIKLRLSCSSVVMLPHRKCLDESIIVCHFYFMRCIQTLYSASP